MSWYSKIYVWVREYRRRHPIQGWFLTLSLNLMLLLQFLIMGYFQAMYLWAVCYRMLTNKIQATVYVCIFEGFAIMALWSFFATILTPRARIPERFKTDMITDANLKAVTPYDGKRYTPDISSPELLMQQNDILRSFCSERNICTMERDRYGDRIR